MEGAVDVLVNAVFHWSDADKAWLKNAFFSNGMGWLWEFLRDYLFNHWIWLFGLLPALLLERLRPVFSGRVFDRHLLMDGVYPFFNALVGVLATAVVVATIAEFYRSQVPFINTGLLDGKPLWLQAVGVFLITDLMFYISHRLLHEIRWFWYFHAIHHSQTRLNPLTTFRSHPGELVLKTIIRTIPIGVVGGEPSTWFVFLVLNNFWGYFIHANIRTGLGILGRVIVTPQYHRIHHSIEPRHFDKNYGERLVLWDWLFGTLYRGDEYPKTGVPDTAWIMETGSRPHELLRAYACQLAYPFVMIGRSVRGFLRGRTAHPPLE